MTDPTKQSVSQDTAGHLKGNPTENNQVYRNSHQGSNDTLTNDNQLDRRTDKSSLRIVSFEHDDPQHPNNWSHGKKYYILATGILIVINSTLGSSLPSGAINQILQSFNVTSEIQAVLPVSSFLMGYVIGPVIFGPMSESIGRQAVMLITFLFYIIFTMACAVTPTWAGLIVLRFLCGTAASSPISVIGGLYADIYSEPRQRGMAMASFMAATTVGPVAAPMVSGFIAENVSWRWVFGVGTFFALISLPFLCFMPETYVPILLSRRAAKLRKKTGENWVAKTDLQKTSLSKTIKDAMIRPFRMLFREVLVAATCAYLALAYSIFYMYFEAYPIIFQGPDSVYKWTPGLAGTAFIPIGVGAIVSGCIFVWWDSYLAKARARNVPWTAKEEYRRLPLACAGGPLYVISLFWLGWTARSDVHWIVPILSGLPFGMGFLLIFMALLNYLSDAYETYAASAFGIASAARSIFGALLPLASHRMFTTLGVNWACTLLAILSMIMALIPFAFIKWGDYLREHSKFRQELKALKEKEAEESESIEAPQISAAVEEKV